MHGAPLPLTRELVLLGGGHTHALVLRKWGMRPLPGVRLTLVNPGPTAPYTGMLPGFVAGHYGRDDLEIDLVRLARFAGARLILGRATGIDRAAGRIALEGHPAIAYDIASLDIGITSGMPGLPGFAEHAVPAKPLARFADRWQRFVAEGGPGPVVVIGGGVAGVELAMAMAWRLRAEGCPRPVTVIEARRALHGTPARARAALLARMDALGVTLLERADVTAVRAAGVEIAGRPFVPSALTVGAAGALPQGWLAGTGLELHEGFVAVDAQLRSSDPAIFAAGDCAHLSHAPRPKAGVFAVRAAPVLAHNLRADLAGLMRRRFRPQRDYLKLISLGGKEAVGERGGLALAGPAVWRLKDRIDRRFMEGFTRLQPMPPPPLPRERARGALPPEPPCGGCGAKMGEGALGAALAGLPALRRGDVLRPEGEDAAILSLGGVRQVISTDHLSALTGDPYTMARIAAVHALGDVWAMGAAPQAALAQIVLPRMAEALQGPWLEEIMAGAAEVFGAAGAEIAGGHTTLGAELTIGFAVTGLSAGAPVARAGGRPGDALVLTRAIGSGTVMAGEMRLAARGPWVAAALETMARPQLAAAAALAGTARAMTDVTGFGLAGHLSGLARASGCAARIELAAVPLYDGAEDLAARGIRSTLHPANRAAAEAAGIALPASPRGALVLDPQTAGGLLAAVPPAAAGAIVAALADAGERAAVVGRLEAGSPGAIAFI